VETRGVLRPHGAPFSLTRHRPAADLAGVLERHWVVRWDLRGSDPYRAETIPNPCVNLVIGSAGSAVHGVVTRRFTRVLEGRGEAVGTQFRPGAFEPFTAIPMANLIDTAVPLLDTFGGGAGTLERDVLAREGDRARIEVVEAFVRGRLPGPDPNRAKVFGIVRSMLEAPADTRVQALTERHGMSVRTMQRLFRRYVGVNPKWVLQRYRLHEAAERIADGEEDLARLALELGYFDQAHFIKDFKGLVGRAPSEYAEECRAPAERRPWDSQ
jgi:AraC-like DNA-binding protein